MRPFDVLYQDASSLVACVDDCVVLIVQDATLGCLNSVALGLGSLKKRYSKVGVLTVINATARTRVSAETREAATQITSRYTHDMFGAALIWPGTGFRATIVRSILTAINMASLAAHPSAVFEATTPAVEWLRSKHPQGRVAVRGLVETVSVLGRRFSASTEAPRTVSDELSDRSI